MHLSLSLQSLEMVSLKEACRKFTHLTAESLPPVEPIGLNLKPPASITKCHFRMSLTFMDAQIYGIGSTCQSFNSSSCVFSAGFLSQGGHTKNPPKKTQPGFFKKPKVF